MDQRLTELVARDRRGAGAPGAAAAGAPWIWPRRTPSSGTRHRRISRRWPRCRGSISPCCKGVERQKQILLDNTLRFARGLPANNAMLWGARGMGKSSLVKAAHAVVNAEHARQPGAGRDPSRGHPHRCPNC